MSSSLTTRPPYFHVIALILWKKGKSCDSYCSLTLCEFVKIFNCRMLKDEIDYLRSASEKASKLELTLETYKVKLKEVGDLRGQVG